MTKIYNNYIILLVLFFSHFALADQVSTKPAKPTALPSFFESSNLPTSLSLKSVFYTQTMEKREFDNFENRFIIIHFWASWCMECKNELIALNRLQKEFHKKALTVIAISEDFKGPTSLDEYFTKNKIDYLDIYIDKKNKIYQSLNINHLPATYLMDFNGNIIAQSKAAIPINWADEDLIKFLDEKVIDHQLLPPEFKQIRDRYEEPKPNTITSKTKEKVKDTKSKIFIN